MHFHANTNVKGGKLKLENVEISLNIEDVIVQIVQSQNPELSETILCRTLLVIYRGISNGR